MSTTRLGGFPTQGKSFAILSTGNATAAGRKNTSPNLSTSLGGPSIRGARDVTILRLDLRVPKKARCLSIRFRFLTEEFPEFIGDVYNDSFIAELDTSSWTTGTKDDPTVTAPGNFAADSDGHPIRVNAVGPANLTSSRARGTTYDGATRRLRASTPVTSGRHILYLSIFDQGDREYDSAVFLDRLTLDRRAPCKSGAVQDS
ncbi:MAG: choice-of-anchor L domain-containing protein [Solirubrobacteraceae bacterium]